MGNNLLVTCLCPLTSTRVVQYTDSGVLGNQKHTDTWPLFVYTPYVHLKMGVCQTITSLHHTLVSLLQNLYTNFEISDSKTILYIANHKKILNFTNHSLILQF